MRAADLLRLSRSSIAAHRLRSLLTALGIAIGIAAVVLLTSIGEGVHRFVVSEFSQFGATTVAVNPGRTTTHGTPLGMFGTARPLTLDDAEALRRVPHVRAVAPGIWGNAEVTSGPRRRRAAVNGVGADFPQIFHLEVASGAFLPPDDPRAARAFAVLGATLQRELFGEHSALGRRIRIGSDRFRVVGVMHAKGQVLGFDLDNSVYIPAGRALHLFNREGLAEIDLLYADGAPAKEVAAGAQRVLTARHGREDFTLTTQADMLEVLGKVLRVLTFAVGALGGISLVVGGVGIATITTIAVGERTGEVGLLRALGASSEVIVLLFLLDATALSAAGGLAGLVVGVGGAQALRLVIPALPVRTTWGVVLLAEALATAIGVVAGVLPARRAAKLDPIVALRAE